MTRTRAIIGGLDVRTVIVVGLALAVVAAYAAAVSLSRDYYVVQSAPGSVHNPGDEGLSVLLRYLEALEVPAEALRAFDELPEAGTIVVAAERPLDKQPTAEEGRRLAEWVERGGRLVLAGPYAREALRGSGVDGGAIAGGPEAAFAPRLPSAYADGVREVTSGPGRLLVAGGAWATHLGDGSGQVMVTRPYGAGEIVWLASVHPLSNAGLAEADNARFATLVAAGAAPVWFDEYHHGFAEGGGVWERLGAGGRAASVLALVGLAIALAASARRFGRPIEPAEVPSARTGAYIGSLAELYRKAGARAEALETLEEGVRLALVRRHGGAEAGREAVPAAARAIDGSVALRESGQITPDRFRAAAGALARARREVEGSDG